MDKIKTVLVDIDGTLAKHVERSPYDYRKLHTDALHEDIAELVRVLFAGGYAIVIVSGRPDEEDNYIRTYEWLEKHNIPFSHLFMRKGGDRRNDSIVKAEIYRNDIEPTRDVFLVLDDRNRVVDAWRNLGLRCLQVAPGDF